MAVPASKIQAWSGVICDRLLKIFPEAPGMCVGFFWPIRNEPDIRAALKNWRCALALPVPEAPDAPLRFFRWTPEISMTSDRYGTPVPSVHDPVTPEALLIPLVAFDALGYRLGYGGGFFDRTLAALRPLRPLTIGIGFEINSVAKLPTEPHDQPMDWIITEERVWHRSVDGKTDEDLSTQRPR